MVNLTENSDITAVTYELSEEDIRNPERGAALQVQYVASCNKSGPPDDPCFEHQPITPEFLKEKLTGKNKNVTLILSRYFFKDLDVSEDRSEFPQRYLDIIKSDFAVVRQAGLKMIVRFAYTRALPDPKARGTGEPLYNDAPNLKTLQGHIEQVQPYLEENQDVIASIEAGWIGVWGEWFYSDIYGTTGQLTPEQERLRREVLVVILAATPSQRLVQLRTPDYKRKLLGEPVTLAKVFDGSPISRSGHHNDCFFKNANDESTYLDGKDDRDGKADREYVATDARYTVNGGETCGRDSGLPVVTRDEALAALKKYHWSYLNFHIASDELGGGTRDTVRPLIKEDEGDFAPYLDDIRKVLGYRLVLLRSEMPSVAFQGEVLLIRLKIRNDGCAAPFNPRAVEVVLRSLDLSSTPEYSLPLPMERTSEGLSPNDPRSWLADGTERLIEANLALPDNIPTGVYAVLLNLPDPSPAATGVEALRKDPRYSIRFANEDLYEPDTGYNALKQTVMIAVRES